jgi:hypothetical protein
MYHHHLLQIHYTVLNIACASAKHVMITTKKWHTKTWRTTRPCFGFQSSNTLIIVLKRHCLLTSADIDGWQCLMRICMLFLCEISCSRLEQKILLVSRPPYALRHFSEVVLHGAQEHVHSSTPRPTMWEGAQDWFFGHYRVTCSVIFYLGPSLTL